VYLPHTKSHTVCALAARAHSCVRVCVCVICEHSLEIKCKKPLVLVYQPHSLLMETSVNQLECVLFCSRTVVYVTAQTHSHKSSLLHLQHTHTNCARSHEFATRESLDKRIERENTSLVCACVRARARESDVSKMYQSRACGETKSSCVWNSLQPLTSERRISRVWNTLIAVNGRQAGSAQSRVTLSLNAKRW
jgi:hypothetical protein